MTSPPIPDPTPLNMVQGETYHFTGTYKVDSVATSIAQYYAHMQIRKRAGAAGAPLVDAISTGSSPDIVVEPSSATGVVAVRIPAQSTALLTKALYHYDLFLVNSTDASDTIRLAWGPVNVSLSATVN